MRKIVILSVKTCPHITYPLCLAEVARELAEVALELADVALRCLNFELIVRN